MSAREHQRIQYRAISPRESLGSPKACDSHAEFDADCGACAETNSDAPEWTL